MDQAKFINYALAAQYCYFDHGILYEDWTGDKNDFSELFSELASPPEIFQFKNFGYFLTILRTDDEIIVTFPGTRKNIHGLKDLDCDFDLKPTETKFFGSKFKIHRGFLDRYKILRNEIITTINQLGDGSKPLILTGHSLGGVLAILTSLEMNLTYGTDSRAHKVVSFGTPKFCCSKLARNLSSNVIRVSNKNDPMVHIIPYEDFEYIGDEIEIVGYDKTWISLYAVTSPFLFFVLNYSIPGFIIILLAVSLHGCALTHSMVNYTKAILDRADSGGDFIPSSRRTTYTYENNNNNSNNMPSNKSALSSIESFLQLIDQLLVPAVETTTKTCLLIPIYFVILISYLFTLKNYMNKLIK